ncbi:methylase [Lujinxingia sediminis]|uniref:Methylase n=1 Tax=Lujinxingia sediminis TaxID=2480984 RepID=A0ABY0CQ94_9DELT|nr:methylase [Lujinxingia sediminis]RVU42498.1 methylase [Lujinxingia sediminis]
MVEVREIRGRTKPGRLRMLDRFVVARLFDEVAIDSTQVVVDVGYGEGGWTTRELFEALCEAAVACEVVGVEVEPGRVQAAQEVACEGLRFVEGGFDLLQVVGREARLVRAMNVLRQYGPHEVAEAHRAWGQAVCEGGYLVEGTCDGEGAIGSAHVVQKRQGRVEKVGLVMWTDFSRGFGPWMFRDWLPADLRRGLRPGRQVKGVEMYGVLERWAELAGEVRREGVCGNREVFERSLARLSDEVGVLDEGRALWGDGIVYVEGACM